MGYKCDCGDSNCGAEVHVEPSTNPGRGEKILLFVGVNRTLATALGRSEQLLYMSKRDALKLAIDLITKAGLDA